MVVYVELAFLENFCLDFLLLALSAYAARGTSPIWRIIIAAAVGGMFALLFPLLSLPPFLKGALKFSVGALLPLLALDKGKRGIGTLFFFAFTFAFGGALTGVQDAPKWLRFPFFLFLGFLTLFLVEKLYKRRALFQHVYDCEVEIREEKIFVRGFLDSGNFASNKGLPVCFLSIDKLYSLLGEKWIFEGKERGHGCDEMQISTQAGEKKIPLYRGVLWVKKGENLVKREAYFAPLTNRIGKEYSLLLNSRILEE